MNCLPCMAAMSKAAKMFPRDSPVWERRFSHSGIQHGSPAFILLIWGWSEVPVVLLFHPDRSSLHPGPCRVVIGDFDFSLNASLLPENHLLGKLYPSGVVLVLKELSIPGRRPYAKMTGM